MKTVTEHIRQRLLTRVHLNTKYAPSLADLQRTEYSPDFEKLRMNRKVIGAMRYGLLGDTQKPQYDRVSSMIKRLERYKNDGNAEHLVDVANLAEMEFVEGRHNGMNAIDDGEHVATI